MADKSSIEWTEATWNPIVGCSLASPGCTNCYAMPQAARIQRMEEGRTGNPEASHYCGTTKSVKGKAVWTGVLKRAPEHILTQPLKWKRPRKIFVNSMSDLFHEDVPDAWIDQVFAIMALCPQHTFQVLTKRSKRMRDYLTKHYKKNFITINDDGRATLTSAASIRIRAALCELIPPTPTLQLNLASEIQEKHGEGFMPRWPLPNVWPGVSVEDQTRANERIPDLLATPAAVRWMSGEPLLGPLDLGRIKHPTHDQHFIDATEGKAYFGDYNYDQCQNEIWGKLDWIVAGGESGPNARPMHPDWLRALRDQCAAANMPFLFKQWGEWVSILDRDKDDPDWRADYSGFERKGHRWLNYNGGIGFHGDRLHVMSKSGKHNSGRTLDGVIHDAYPEPR